MIERESMREKSYPTVQELMRVLQQKLRLRKNIEYSLSSSSPICVLIFHSKRTVQQGITNDVLWYSILDFTVAQLWQVQFTRHGLLCFRMEDHSSPVQVNRTCPSWATVMIICIKVHSGKLHLPELGA
jgi:hypothetical protein